MGAGVHSALAYVGRWLPKMVWLAMSVNVGLHQIMQEVAHGCRPGSMKVKFALDSMELIPYTPYTRLLYRIASHAAADHVSLEDPARNP